MMRYQHIPDEKPKVPICSTLSEDMRHTYVYGVVIPYSSNLRDSNMSLKGTERLSFYSAFALNAAIEMYNNRVFQKFVLFSDATFGKERKSTGALMKEALLRARTTRRIQESDIILFEANHLNNTPAQVKELRKYQLRNNLPSESFLVINWSFHNERICRYMKGFGITTDTVTVEKAHKYYNSKFQAQRLYQVLPKAFENREKKLSLLARFDRRGLIPQFLKRLTGPVVTDIQKNRHSGEFYLALEGTRIHLIFDNLSGKEKLRRLEKKNEE